MPVIDVTRNLDARALVLTAEFAAPVTRVWQIYADPRQLERVWGPPTYPATVVHHSLTPGGEVHYLMTGPNGEKAYGGWRVISVDEPREIVIEDFFADENFTPDDDLPVAQCVFTFEPIGQDRTRVTYTTVYPTAENLQQVIDMGMEEGVTQATNQIDDLLAAG